MICKAYNHQVTFNDYGSLDFNYDTFHDFLLNTMTAVVTFKHHDRRGYICMVIGFIGDGSKFSEKNNGTLCIPFSLEGSKNGQTITVFLMLQIKWGTSHAS